MVPLLSAVNGSLRFFMGFFRIGEGKISHFVRDARPLLMSFVNGVRVRLNPNGYPVIGTNIATAALSDSYVAIPTHRAKARPTRSTRSSSNRPIV